jgi:hypothetical protein
VRPSPVLAPVLRLKREWRLKLLLSVVITTAYYAGYFSLQTMPLTAPAVIGASALDHAIPFDPRWAAVYLSLMLFIPVAPWLMDTRKELLGYCRALLVLMAVGFGVFFFWPTRCLRPPMTPDMSFLYRFLRGVDRDLNACPSFHAIFAIYTCLCCQRVFRLMGDRGWMRLAAWAWTGLILYATLATKQHVTADLLAGGLLGLAGYCLYVRFAEYADPPGRAASAAVRSSA